MSSTHGHGRTPVNEVIAFRETLDRGAWASVPLAQVSDEQGLAPLAGASLLSATKTRVWWSIGRLSAAFGRDPEALKNKDNAWDSCERRFHHALAEREEDPEPAVRADAALIRKVVFDNHTVGQTNFSYDDEVTFGKLQVEVATENAQIAQALTRLGLFNRIEEVKNRTDDLEAAIKAAEGASPGRGRFKSVRAERQLCTSALNNAHDTLETLRGFTPEGPERDTFSQLLKPFMDLLDNNAPPERP